MSIKKLLPIVTLAVLTSSFAFADCSKKEAQDAVEKACSQIEASGKDALKDIGAFRYCGENYVWVQDSDVKMVLHPIKPKLNGGDLTGHVDEKGVKLFVEFDKTAKKAPAGGWVDYMWAKPGEEKATPKTSFVKLCKGDLKWIAGSGIWK